MKIVVTNDEFLTALREIKKNAEPRISGEVVELEFENKTSSLSICFGGAGRIIKADGSWPHRLTISRLKAEALCDVLPEENPLELKIISGNSLQIGKSLVIKCESHYEEETCERIDINNLLASLTFEEFGNSGTYQKEFIIFMEDIRAALHILHKYEVDTHRVLDVIGESLGFNDTDGGKEKTAELRRCYRDYLNKNRQSAAEKK